MEENKECSMHLFENVQQSRLLQDFFEQRLEFILDNKYPTSLATDPFCRFVMYLIPQKFQETFLDITKLDSPDQYLIPLGEAENTIISDFNYDGIIFFSSVHLKHAYTQVFRDGKIETVVAVARASDTRENLLHLIKFQSALIKNVKRDLTTLQRNNVPGPYNLYFRLLSAEGLRIDPHDIAIAGYDAKGRNRALVRNNIDFPIYRFEHADIDLNKCLQPFFDIAWNMFGFRESPRV